MRGFGRRTSLGEGCRIWMERVDVTRMFTRALLRDSNEQFGNVWTLLVDRLKVLSNQIAFRLVCDETFLRISVRLGFIPGLTVRRDCRYWEPRIKKSNTGPCLSGWASIW